MDGKDKGTADFMLLSDDDDGEIEIEEEALVAVMKSLEEEISSPSTSSRFLNPSGGRCEESCGSSFSASASTVMASVDETSAVAAVMACLVGGPSDRAEAWPWAVGSGQMAAVGPACGSESEAVDEGEGEEEEEWLARVLAGPMFELEECFL